MAGTRSRRFPGPLLSSMLESQGSFCFSRFKLEAIDPRDVHRSVLPDGPFHCCPHLHNRPRAICMHTTLHKPGQIVSSRKQTAADRIRATLADAIVQGEIGPGVVLDETSLAERFSVSRTPVREAIRQLEAIGFAEARPHRGAVVPNFTPEKLTEMFLVMAELEALCAQYAAERASEHDLKRLQQAHADCADSARQGDIDLYYQTNVAFHEVIYELSGNGFLAEVTLGVRNRVSPFRKAQFRSIGRLMRSVEEHQVIVDAIVSRRAGDAGKAMRDHLAVVRTSVGDVAPVLR